MVPREGIDRRVPVLEPPPADVAADLRELTVGLDKAVPVQKELDRNLLVATWNIRAFDDLTEKWVTAEGVEPKRNLADVRAIAEIVSRFDVIAIQEARANLKALRHMLKVLGPDWGLILTDVDPRPEGNNERLAFIYDTRRVKPSGLAAELVVAGDRPGTGALDRQFVRTPYAVSFESAGQTFILVTLHVIWGKNTKDRVPELEGIAQWLAAWAQHTEAFNQNLICLGDFNTERAGDGDPGWKAFTSTGLAPPDEFKGKLRTVTDTPGKEHYYDEIAWFHDNGKATLTLDYTGHAGNFLWTDYLYRDLQPDEKSWHISDHYPLWCEFSVRGA